MGSISRQIDEDKSICDYLRAESHGVDCRCIQLAVSIVEPLALCQDDSFLTSNLLGV